jgi:hypothetical protein
VREAYRQKIQDHIMQHKAICDAVGWMHVVHRTDQPYSATLETIYGLNAARMLAKEPHAGAKPG